MITEEIAKTKTCPIMRNVDNPAGVAHDREIPQYAYQNCIGSDCMAWRKDNSPAGKQLLTGYCGLVGKP